eukprot:1110674-Rhodomonas_salina.2
MVTTNPVQSILAITGSDVAGPVAANREKQRSARGVVTQPPSAANEPCKQAAVYSKSVTSRMGPMVEGDKKRSVKPTAAAEQNSTKTRRPYQGAQSAPY